MRKQHKSVAEIKIKEEEISTKLDHHEEENLIFAENSNPIQIDTNYEEFNKSSLIEELQREKTKTGMNQQNDEFKNKVQNYRSSKSSHMKCRPGKNKSQRLLEPLFSNKHSNQQHLESTSNTN